ncbi:MAG: S26 family signal peptidase [Flavobacteriales bacterium]|jgi:signal peptidase I|nr:S26 family signal peptidase [Flavobacteriales bacterium]
MIPYLFLFAYLLVLLASLWKLFQKAGKPAWAAFVPGYNLLVWLQITGKPWWWIFLFLVPGVNLLMLIIMNVNISIVLGRRDFKEHVLMTFLPWWKVPETCYAQNTYVGPIPVAERKRGLLGQWGDAILFAVIVATVFRTFTFEAFTIPTPSMEKSLLVGDYLFVSKLSYGPRMPMTPLTFPFTHHTLPLTTSTPSFVNWFSQPYRRLPGFGTPERGDAVVFNFPEGDTVVANFQNQSYYQLVREHGRKKVQDPAARLPSIDDRGRRVMKPTGGILVRPIDKRENYIKRCVAIAGDSVQVVHGVLRVNGQDQPIPPDGQYAYEFQLKSAFRQDMLKKRFDISPSDVLDNGRAAVIPMSGSVAEQVGKFDNVVSMHRQDHPEGFYDSYGSWPIFPNHPDFHWTEDNFGPIWVPKKGGTVELNARTLPLYRRAITLYEGNTLEERNGEILINGAAATSYTFQQDYYWLMGDNRHRSQDSRFWGFVPHDHVVGKAVLIWFTKDPYTGIRWKRLFSGVK